MAGVIEVTLEFEWKRFGGPEERLTSKMHGKLEAAGKSGLIVYFLQSAPHDVFVHLEIFGDHSIFHPFHQEQNDFYFDRRKRDG